MLSAPQGMTNYHLPIVIEFKMIFKILSKTLLTHPQICGIYYAVNKNRYVEPIKYIRNYGNNNNREKDVEERRGIH